MSCNIVARACILLQITRGTLIHSKSNPFVIELSTYEIHGPKAHAHSLLLESNVTIGDRKFSCSKRTADNLDVQRSHAIHSTREKVIEGVCWTVVVDEHDRRFYKICKGEEIKEYQLKGDGSFGIPKFVAGLKQVNESVWRAWGLEEEFEGPEIAARVRYVCSHILNKEPKLISSKPQIHVEISTPIVCPELNYHELHVILSSIPRLNMISEDRWWNYQYEYPNRLMHIHVDPSGSTPDEFFSLGNHSEDGMFHHKTRYLDPDNPYIQNHMEYKFVNGTLCDKHNIFRETIVRFRCPHTSVDTKGNEWLDHEVSTLKIDKKFRARLAKIKEPDVCTYELNIEATALCLDPLYIPRELNAGPSTLVCTSK
jgi:hypothetical protein